MMVGFQVGPRCHQFHLQETLRVSEAKVMICFSPPPDLAAMQQGKQLLGECVGNLEGGCGGHCWACLHVEHRMGKIPSHSLWREGEHEREEIKPALGWSGGTGTIRLTVGGVEEEEGSLGLEMETAAGTRKGTHPWPLLWPKAEVLASPSDRLHTEPLQQLPGQRRQLHF